MGEIVDLVSKGGLLGACVIVIITGFKGYWVFGWVHKQVRDDLAKMQDERDQWRDLALTGSELAVRATKIARILKG